MMKRLAATALALSLLGGASALADPKWLVITAHGNSDRWERWRAPHRRRQRAGGSHSWRSGEASRRRRPAARALGRRGGGGRR